MAEIGGTCDKRFKAVRELFGGMLDSTDVGASVAVFLAGEPVVDLWGGYTDAERTTPWQQDTIVNVWSTTKTMAALCALVLFDRGLLDPDAPVARYWPEFTGKETLLVRHILSHTAGLPTWDRRLTVEDLYDHDTAAALLAAQSPRWAPGTVGCYHSLTQGYLIGELVRRVTGRTLGRFFAEELARPLNADFHIGLSPEHDHRVAEVIPPPLAEPPAPTELYDAPPNPLIPAEVANTLPWRRAEIPAANGHGNARSVAAVQSVLSNGGTALGVRLLSEAGAARAMEQQYEGTDYLLGWQMTYGMGFAVIGGTCSWGGWGGSLVLGDPANKLTVAYTMNRMLAEGPVDDSRGQRLVLAAYEGVS